jgi:hypothetical protein
MHFKKEKNIPENACPKKCPILHAELWTSYIADIEPRDSISIHERVHEDILESMESYYEFWLSLCKIVRSAVILLLPLS